MELCEKFSKTDNFLLSIESLEKPIFLPHVY